MTFSEWLEDRLKELGMSKVQLARQLGISSAAISQWLSGVSEPAHQRVPALAGVLRVTAYEIYLRLGRIAPRPPIDESWELFISRVEKGGPEFKDVVFKSLDDMLQEWRTRPRSWRVYFNISIGRMLESVPPGYRAYGQTNFGRLILYCNVPILDESEVGLLLEGHESPPDSGLFSIAGDINGYLPSGASLRLNGVRHDAVLEGDHFVFEYIPVRQVDDLAQLVLTYQGQGS